MRVLIADDDVVLRFGLQAHLGRWGFDPVACADGLEAQRVLARPDPPPIALLDRSMPGLDGLTLCRLIRETPAIAGTHVMLLTAHDDPDERRAGLIGGADDYLIKPVDWHLLRARLCAAAGLSVPPR